MDTLRPCPTDTPVSLLDRLRCSEGERDWEVFLEVYSGLIAKWLNRAGVDSRDLEDLKQEILMALLRAVPAFQHNGRAGAFRKWLKTLVTQRVLNHLRHRRYREGHQPLSAGNEELLAVEDQMLVEEWEREHDQHVLQKLLMMVEAHFTTTTWLAFHRQVFGHCSASQVADELGITCNAALIAKSRVLRRLREEARGLVD